jgi:cytochrome c5
MKKGIVFICLAASLVACSVKAFEPTEDSIQLMQQKVPGITMERAQQGFVIYKNKCAGCHHLYKPAQYTIRQWDPIIKKMFPKAKVTDSLQQALISDYLHALSK